VDSLAEEAEKSLRLLCHMRDFDPGRLKDASGGWKPWADLDPMDRACITVWDKKSTFGKQEFGEFPRVVSSTSTRVRWVDKAKVCMQLLQLAGVVNG
jgi:hypothetical protein